MLQPTPILPIYTSHRSVILFTEQKHLPFIKDRMIKANLAQKANFKCKSPAFYRPDSSLSRSTAAVVNTSQVPTKTNNPFKVSYFSQINLESFLFTKYLINHLIVFIF